METIFSTENIHPADRFDCWYEAARKMLVDHDSHTLSRLTFEARLDAAVYEDVSLISFTTSSMVAEHTSRHVDLGADELYLCRQMNGVLRLEHGGRASTLQPGDMALFDPRMPYCGHFGLGAGLLVLKVPRRDVLARLGSVGDIMGHSLRPTLGLCGLTSQYLALLPAHFDAIQPAMTGMVIDQALDLFAASVAGALGHSRPRLSSARMVVLTQLRAVIERHLTDVDLTPADIAAAAGVSVRYANSVLAAENTSLARLIQTRRLERCRQALIDPLQSRRTIADIAQRWGFSDMTHFARRFRRIHGVLPSEYRARHARELEEPQP